MRYLKDLWLSQVKDIKRIKINTPADNLRSCAIANVGVEGIKPAELAKILLDKYKIWTVAIDSSNVQGVRITPHVFTTVAEINKLVIALKEIAS